MQEKIIFGSVDFRHCLDIFLWGVKTSMKKRKLIEATFLYEPDWLRSFEYIYSFIISIFKILESSYSLYSLFTL